MVGAHRRRRTNCVSGAKRTHKKWWLLSLLSRRRRQQQDKLFFSLSSRKGKSHHQHHPCAAWCFACRCVGRTLRESFGGYCSLTLCVRPRLLLVLHIGSATADRPVVTLVRPTRFRQLASSRPWCEPLSARVAPPSQGILSFMV